MRSAALLLLALVAVPAATAHAQEPLAADSAAAIAFWESVQDPVLQRLIGRALTASPQLDVAQARVSAARADRSTATLDLLPTVTASAGYSRQQLATASFPGAGSSLPAQDVWDAGLQLSWEVDVFGRLRRSLRGRSELVGATQEDARETGVLLVAEVARTYFELREAQELLAVAARNAENQRRTLDLTKDRLAAGRGTAVDTERAQAQLSSTLAAIPQLEAAVTAAQNRIAVLLGQSPATVVEELNEAPCSPVLPEELPIADPAGLVRQRPDVRAAEHRVAASSAFLDAAKAEYLPRLSIGGTAGYAADTFDGLGSTGTPRYVIGPVLSWPLFDLGRVRTRVDAARAGTAEAAARQHETMLRAIEEIETSVNAYAKARERLQHLEDAAAASERATALARLRFEGGAADFLEVLDAERRLLEAQERLAAGRTEAAGWLVAVYQSVGGAWSGPSAGR